MQGIDRNWRAHAVLALVPVVGWAAFHIFEQWSAFGGRDAFVARMLATSHGTLALALETALVVLPLTAWIALEIRLRLRRREPPALRGSLAEDPTTARRLHRLTVLASWLFMGWLVYHVGWLWLPKWLSGSDPTRTWGQLQSAMGTWPHAIANALGLSAFVFHVWAAIVRGTVALGWASDAESRRAARLVGLIVAALFVLLGAQLIGWHAAGTGTVWSM